MGFMEKKLNFVFGQKLENVCGKETIEAVGRNIYPYFA